MCVGIEGRRVVVAAYVLSMGRTNLQSINMVVWRNKTESYDQSTLCWVRGHILDSGSLHCREGSSHCCV